MNPSKPDTRDPETFAIIGAAMVVHSELGCGFLEAVYQRAMEIEFAERGIAMRPQVVLDIYYKGKLLDCGYCADFIAEPMNCHISGVI